jgi:hypothetical protein
VATRDSEREVAEAEAEPKGFPSDATPQWRSFPVPFESPPTGAQQIPARDFRAHSPAELKTKIKMRNPEFYAHSGFAQGIHGILFLYREIELLIRLTKRNSTVLKSELLKRKRKYDYARRAHLCNAPRKAVFPVSLKLSYTSE